MQCDNRAVDVAQCPSTGLWFCNNNNDKCREQYRLSEPHHFAQMIKRKLLEAATANAGLRRSSRKPKPVLVLADTPPAPQHATRKTTVKTEEGEDDDDDDDNDRARKAAKTSKENTNKKRSSHHHHRPPQETTSHSNVVLADALSTRLYRLTEDQKRALRTGRAKLLGDGSKVDEALLAKLRKTRTELLHTYQEAIDHFNTYMDHLEQTMEQWQAMRLAPDDRYEQFQDYLANTRARVEKLRVAYDAAEENYSDAVLGSGEQQRENSRDDERHHQPILATDGEMEVEGPPPQSPILHAASLSSLSPSPSPPHSPVVNASTATSPQQQQQQQQQPPTVLTPHNATPSSAVQLRRTHMTTTNNDAITLLQPQMLAPLFVHQSTDDDEAMDPESASTSDDKDDNDDDDDDDPLAKFLLPVKVKTEPGLFREPTRDSVVLEISSDEESEDSSEEEEEEEIIAHNNNNKKHKKTRLPVSPFLLYSPKKSLTPPKSLSPPSLLKRSAQTTVSRPMSEGKKAALRGAIRSLSTRLEEDVVNNNNNNNNNTQVSAVMPSTKTLTSNDVFKEISTIDDNIPPRQHHNAPALTPPKPVTIDEGITDIVDKQQPSLLLPYGVNLEPD